MGKVKHSNPALPGNADGRSVGARLFSRIMTDLLEGAAPKEVPPTILQQARSLAALMVADLQQQERAAAGKRLDVDALARAATARSRAETKLRRALRDWREANRPPDVPRVHPHSRSPADADRFRSGPSLTLAEYILATYGTPEQQERRDCLEHLAHLDGPRPDPDVLAEREVTASRLRQLGIEPPRPRLLALPAPIVRRRIRQTSD